MKPIFLAMCTYLDASNEEVGLPKAILVRLDEPLVREMEACVERAQAQPNARLKIQLPATSYVWLSTVAVTQAPHDAGFGLANPIVAPRTIAPVEGFFDPSLDTLHYAGSAQALSPGVRAGRTPSECVELASDDLAPACLELIGGTSLITGHIEVGIHVESSMKGERLFTYGTNWSTIHPELNRHINGARLESRAPLFPSSTGDDSQRAAARAAVAMMQAVSACDLVHPIGEDLGVEDVLDWGREFAAAGGNVDPGEFALAKALRAGWTTIEARKTATTPAEHLEWSRKIAVAQKILAIPPYVPRSSAHQVFMDHVWTEAAERALYAVATGGRAEAHHLDVVQDGRFQKLTYDGISVASVQRAGPATAGDWIAALRSNLDSVQGSAHSVSIKVAGKRILCTAEDVQVVVHSPDLQLSDEGLGRPGLSMGLRFSSDGMTRDLVSDRGELVATETERYADTAARLGDQPVEDESPRDTPRH